MESYHIAQFEIEELYDIDTLIKLVTWLKDCGFENFEFTETHLEGQIEAVFKKG